MATAALSHVYLDTHVPLNFAAEGAACVSYDDGNRLLLVATGGSVLSYPVDASAWAEAGSAGGVPPTVTPVGEGPALAARFSLDGKVLAVQRSATDVEFVPASGGSGGAFWQRCRRPAETVLGFFWASSAGVDFVLATTGGLELYALLPARNGLRLVDEKRKAGVAWLLYTHETRLALLGCGPQGNKLFGFQFSGAGHVKLPKFELPVPAGGAAVTPAAVRLLAVYGRLFCAHVDREARTLVLYRFYRDALLRQHSFPLPSASVALSVIDNAVVLHTLDSGVALVLDVLSASTHPLASPLPLGGAPLPSLSAVPGALPDAYGADCEFLAPDLLLHTSIGCMWRLKLDLRALAASCSDRPVLIGFLQRRREPALRNSAGSGDAVKRSPDGPKALTIAVVRTILQEREPLADLGRVFDVLCAACANVATAASSPGKPDGAAARPKGAIPPGSPAVTAEEMQAEVFAPLAEEAGMDSLYLRAALVDYLRAADAAGIPVPASLPVLLTDLLVRDGCAHQLPMWAPLLLPHAASRAQPAATLAAQSLAAAAEGPAATDGVRQMAVDAQRRALAHDTLVRDMLTAGQVLQALRYVRRHRVESVPPAVFMEAAAAQDDPPVYASTYRFCSEYVPGFAELPDYSYYTLRLQGTS